MNREVQHWFISLCAGQPCLTDDASDTIPFTSAPPNHFLLYKLVFNSQIVCKVLSNMSVWQLPPADSHYQTLDAVIVQLLYCWSAATLKTELLSIICSWHFLSLRDVSIVPLVATVLCCPMFALLDEPVVDQPCWSALCSGPVCRKTWCSAFYAAPSWFNS